jgi:hypothetical protein
VPWMCLVGVVADGRPDSVSGLQNQHTAVRLGKGPTDVDVEREGYLYAFANDAWGFYDNNQGQVRLRVMRLSSADRTTGVPEQLAEAQPAPRHLRWRIPRAVRRGVGTLTTRGRTLLHV